LASDLVRGEDGRRRCRWGAGDDLYRQYHDTEWGRPVLDEQGLFERLSLECLQSGLSWALILRKRDGIRDAFAGFDPDVVAGFGAAEVAALLEDARVIRNRRKVEAIVRNAQATVSMRADVALPELVWSFRRPTGRAPRSFADMVSFSAESMELAMELKRRGFTFVGPTTVYSTLQAVGVVNDHLAGCFATGGVEAALRKVQVPSGSGSNPERHVQSGHVRGQTPDMAKRVIGRGRGVGRRG
jgi:DNA-3-methyladenine glycosylase I